MPLASAILCIIFVLQRLKKNSLHRFMKRSIRWWPWCCPTWTEPCSPSPTTWCSTTSSLAAPSACSLGEPSYLQFIILLCVSTCAERCWQKNFDFLCWTHMRTKTMETIGFFSISIFLWWEGEVRELINKTDLVYLSILTINSALTRAYPSNSSLAVVYMSRKGPVVVMGC